MSDVEVNNLRRWERFKSDPDYDIVVEHVLDVLDAAGLTQSSMGDTWGLTVHVDKDTFLRLNHADYALFDIRDPHLDLKERRVVVAHVPDGAGKPSLLARGIFKLSGARGRSGTGFTKLIPESETLWTTFDDLKPFLNRADFREAIGRHVTARGRKLYSVNRHNPHSAAIFD